MLKMETDLSVFNICGLDIKDILPFIGSILFAVLSFRYILKSVMNFNGFYFGLENFPEERAIKHDAEKLLRLILRRRRKDILLALVFLALFAVSYCLCLRMLFA